MRSLLAAMIVLAAVPACSKKDTPAAPAATPPGTAPDPETPGSRLRPQGPPAPPVDCNAILTPDEVSQACGKPLTAQVQPDEGKGRARRVSCSRVFNTADGQRVTFRIQSDPRGDSDINIKTFNSESQFPRNWEDVQPVPNLGDGARRFSEKGGLTLGKTPRPNGGKHLRFVKGIWRVSLQASAAREADPTGAVAAAPDLCGFDQLEVVAHKIADRLPASPPPPAPVTP